MARGMKFLTGGVLALALFATQAGAQNQAIPAQSGNDQRQEIQLEPAARSLVLEEMRQFLSGVQQMTEALSRDDLKTVAKAARGLGMQAAHEVPDAVKAQLPMGFKQLGFSVHKDFDQLALDADNLGDGKYAMKQLSITLKKCVACHTTYQINPVAGR